MVRLDRNRMDCILRFPRLMIAVFLFGSILQVNGQTNNEQNDPYLAVNNIYHEIIGLNQLILNGRSYEHSYYQADGNQFLVDNKLTSGTIVYDGVVYEGLMLNYDIYNDIVYFLWNGGGIPKYIILNEYRISAFYLHGMNFIRIKPNEIKGLEEGFYQLVFSGNETQLLMKRQKKLIKQSLNATTDRWYIFNEASSYYLIEDGTGVPIKNKKNFLNSFGENPRLKGFIKENKIRLGVKNPFFLENALKVLEFVEAQ